MQNIVIYVGTVFSLKQSQKIAKMLRIHHIATTNNAHYALFVYNHKQREKI